MSDLAAIVARDKAAVISEWSSWDSWATAAADRRALLELIREMHTALVDEHDHHGIICTPDDCRLMALLLRLDVLLPTADDVRGILA